VVGSGVGEPVDIYCSNCEHPCSEAAASCPKCGHPLRAIEVQPAVQPIVQVLEATPAPMIHRTVTGCPRCGSLDLRQKRYTTRVGWGLFVIGVLGLLPSTGAPCLFFVTVPVILLACFLTERRARCRDCRWTWRV
jgi:hypothetical protein